MKKQHIVWLAILVLFIGFVVWLIRTPGRQVVSKYDGFATCLKDKGVTFYGAFWCPHCQAQKALFGSAQKLLPYVECSNPDGNSQNETCNTAKITSYPTWEFPNGERLTGEQTFETLAEKSSCELPAA
ncbi:MAG: thioredoxin domain-containing protein [Patescibacteria group bacterium]